MPRPNIRNRSILVSLDPLMKERLDIVATRVGIRAATLAALAVGELVARLETSDRAIEAAQRPMLAMVERELGRVAEAHRLSLADAEHDRSAGSIAP